MLGNFLKVDLPQNRVFGLDVLRAAAILFVVYMHGSSQLAGLLPEPWVQLFFMDGVSIFFVLSGYLIGGIILRNFERSPASNRLVWRFWIRRWFRTLPNYFLVLGVLATYHLAFGSLSLDTLWPYLIFLQNFASEHPAFFPEAWSLAVEEWFYIFLPLCLIVLTRFGLRIKSAFLSIIIFTIISSLLIRYIRFHELETLNLYSWDSNFRKLVVTRLDSLIYGVLGAYIHHYYKEIWNQKRRVFLLFGLGLLVMHKASMLFQISALQAFGLYYSVFSFVLVSLGTLLLLPWLSQLHLHSGLFYRWVTLISLISYSMYLVHLSLVQFILVPASLELIAGSLSGKWVLVVHYGIYWLYTIVISIILYKYFELPLMNQRQRFSVPES